MITFAEYLNEKTKYDNLNEESKAVYEYYKEKFRNNFERYFDTENTYYVIIEDWSKLINEIPKKYTIVSRTTPICVKIGTFYDGFYCYSTNDLKKAEKLRDEFLQIAKTPKNDSKCKLFFDKYDFKLDVLYHEFKIEFL